MVRASPPVTEKSARYREERPLQRRAPVTEKSARYIKEGGRGRPYHSMWSINLTTAVEFLSVFATSA
ncbi:hypothetical protein [Scytonema hofmannii]|uniref:hypothetical protein n=1 Tax=Scytonema hofmannii TaxID=34078 RepID=UPI0011DF6CC0|nr:hypothetical protein [Scytonema hofmannii]